MSGGRCHAAVRPYNPQHVALIPGTRIGVYEITVAFGSGGMGEVYRARDTTLGRDVALKTLPASLAADPERLARFEREAKNAGLAQSSPHRAEATPRCYRA